MRAYELHAREGGRLFLNGDRSTPSLRRGQVLVRVRACALNYRDLMVRDGRYRGNRPANLVPLSDGAGEIVALGADVQDFALGAHVAGAFFPAWIGGPISAAATARALGGSDDGMLSEYAVLDAAAAVPVPVHLSFAEAATLPCAAVTAWNALIETARLKAGDTVLLLGTGGVSMFALQIALLHGAHVIITSGSDEKLARAKQLGASQTINYAAKPDWDKDVLQLTEGRGVDVVVEVGGAGTLERSLKSVRVGGCVALIGVLTGAGGIDPRPLLSRSIRLQGIYVGSVAMFQAMNRAIAAHALRPVIDRVFAFDEAPAGFDHLASGKHLGKVVIEIQ